VKPALESVKNQPIVFELPSLFSVVACLLQLLERHAANVISPFPTKPYLQQDLQSTNPRDY